MSLVYSLLLQCAAGALRVWNKSLVIRRMSRWLIEFGGLAVVWEITPGLPSVTHKMVVRSLLRRRSIMADDNGSGGAMWAVATLIIVLVVVAALYFGGAFNKKKSIDININKPGVILPVAVLHG